MIFFIGVVEQDLVLLVQDFVCYVRWLQYVTVIERSQLPWRNSHQILQNLLITKEIVLRLGLLLNPGRKPLKERLRVLFLLFLYRKELDCFFLTLATTRASRLSAQCATLRSLQARFNSHCFTALTKIVEVDIIQDIK